MEEVVAENRPKLFNKLSIVVFSCLLSTIFGGILYSQNLAATGNRKQIPSVIIFCVVWNILTFRIADHITNIQFLTFLLPNIIGGIILAFPFWNYHFKQVTLFYKRKIWGPLIVVSVIYGALIIGNILIN